MAAGNLSQFLKQPAEATGGLDGRHSLIVGLHQYYAHNCTRDVHGAGGEAQMRVCRIDYEIQSKQRDPEAASSHQFFHMNVHTDFLQVEGNQLALKTDCGILLLRLEDARALIGRKPCRNRRHGSDPAVNQSRMVCFRRRARIVAKSAKMPIEIIELFSVGSGNCAKNGYFFVSCHIRLRPDIRPTGTAINASTRLMCR
jgi:hypothetical protein